MQEVEEKATESQQEGESLEEEKKTPEEGAEDGSPESAFKEELEKLKSKTQKRIDQLIAQNKSLHEKLEDLTGKFGDTEKGEEDILGKIKANTQEIVNRMDQIEDEILAAYDDGDKKKASTLRRERLKLQEALNDLRDEYKDYQSKQKSKQEQKQLHKDFKRWQDSWTEAGKEYPELLNDDGSLNTKSDLFLESAKILGTEGRKPKYAKWLSDHGMLINPKYDKPEGPIMAVYKAAQNLARKEISKDKETITRENKALRAKDQVIASPEGGGPLKTSQMTRKELDRLESQAIKDGRNSPAFRKYLSALAKYEGRR